MKEPRSQQTLQTEEEVTLVTSGEETTLVAPRFDDEETLVARPVVPLDAATAEASHAPTPAPYATTPPLPPYARRSRVPRRSWMLALVLTSVLVGGVLGGAGLYIYQRQSNDGRVVATPRAESLTETPADTPTQPVAAEPAVEASNAPQPEAPPAVAEPTDAPAAVEEEATAAPPAREPETEPAADRRDDTEPGRGTGTRKRGKKGEHDEVTERPRPVARAEADDDAPREARRVDTIFYRERRAMRRERARARRDGGNVDRLRRIFEGTP